MKKIAVYTALFGDYDTLKPPPIDPGCDYFCFTDQAQLNSEVYQIKRVQRQFDEQARDARFYKILSHHVLPGYDYTLWLDASATFRFTEIENFVRSVLKEHNFAAHNHPCNDDIYNELKRCVRFCKDDEQIMKSQVERYQSEGFPENSGMIASGLLVRKSADEKLQELERLWWHEISNGSFRDQLSFNYVAWKLGVSYNAFDMLNYIPKNDPEFRSKFFEFWMHKR